ncbi:RNA polymerase II transcription mediator complex subunit 9 domain-containing protein [Sarocladium implicatum]|nr:RNA polymerase II transcription mediator complex subunit 9 domain-containing protein [Sarocladium implicatum]
MADPSVSKAASQPLTLPSSFSPDTLDALTALAVELSRVRTGLVQASSGEPPSQQQQQQQQPPLAIKDVPGVTDAIKHKIQRARATVKGLPDMSRGIQEQEQEMRELEEKIEKQRRVLEGLREKGESRGEGTGDKMEM